MKNKGQKNGLNAAPLWLVYAAALKRIPIWTEPSEEIALRSFKELYFTINGRKKKGECFSSSNWLKLFNVWLRRRIKGPSVAVGGRCPWCWNESPAKGLPKCCCSLWKLSDVTKSVANCSHIINLVSFVFFKFFFLNKCSISVFFCSSTAGELKDPVPLLARGISFSVYLWLSC